MTFQTKIKIGTLFLFGLFACAFFVPKGEMQTKVETAGQRFKNIKVLNDLPADQLGEVMNIFAASLGGDCKKCHVSNDKDFEKDDNRSKNTARAMIHMVFDINKNNFKGQTQVSCNTCHNGRENPRSVPSLEAPVPAPERPKQPEVKPTIDQILANYAAAVKGKGKMVSSRLIQATRLEGNGKSEPETIEQSQGKIRVKVIYPETPVTATYDGTKVTTVTKTGEIQIQADQAEQIKREAMLFANPDLKSVYAKLDYRFLDRLNDREVYLVLGTTADNQRDRLFFDKETGLLVRRVSVTATMLGAFPFQYDYSDYKDYGGSVKLPATVAFAMPNQRWTRKIVKVQNNAKIEI